MTTSNEVKSNVKIPEPVGVITGKLGEHCSFKSNVIRKGDSVYSEAQPREALAQQADEIQRLKSLLRIADIKLAQIEAKDMQDNPDDYVMQY